MALFDTKTEAKKGLKKLTPKESPLAMRLLSRPRVTEKSYALNAMNKYVFEVTKTSTKKSVKRAVEEVYGVNVVAVHMVRLPAKKHYSGRNRTLGYKSAIKKAIVSVAAGQTIELFKAGV
jgi:large subunit ribosomal protein L23